MPWDPKKVTISHISFWNENRALRFKKSQIEKDTANSINKGVNFGKQTAGDLGNSKMQIKAQYDISYQKLYRSTHDNSYNFIVKGWDYQVSQSLFQ